MNGPDKNLQQLLALALDKSVEGRRALTATMAELFSARGEVLSERERALMSDILRKLIRDCEMAVRRDLSERLAKTPNPPHDLMVALANDEIEVAQPVLMAAGVLRDIELIQIIRHRTQQHQLAIAMRRSLSESVADALVETGDVDVIKTLIENPEAQISEATMAYLAEESRRIDSYQEPLIKRKDLKPDLAKRMYLWVSAALRQHILQNFSIDPNKLDDQLEAIPDAISSDPAQHAADPNEGRAATVLAKRLTRERSISWEFLIQILRQGEISLFEALFGQISGLEPERVQRVLYDSGGEGLAIACRALNMPKPTFATIFLLSRRGRPGRQVIHPRDLSRALLLFERAGQNAAMAVLTSWRRGEAYQSAIEQIAETIRQPESD